ncbi:superoxide dismutase [Chytriomyces cf. hyalinus JEL632]|nr:superoxide dismutase [Chytriomyces cf. hyalinus JEL632]
MASSEPTTSITAFARLVPTVNQTISGNLVFVQKDGSVTLSLELTGAAPNSTHGFHLHGFGDTSDNKAANMFGHFNPTGVPHGCPEAGQESPIQLKTGFHLGDLGSITADESGSVKQTWISNELSLDDASAKGFVLGRGVVVHSAVDDCTTQPTGNSGARLAQGVVTTGEGNPFITKNAAASSKDNAIVVFDGKVVSGTVIAKKAAASDDFAFLYNLTGLSASTDFVVGVNGYTGGKECKDQIFSIKSDAKGAAAGSSSVSGFAPGLASILGQTLLIEKADCKPFATSPIGARNATLDAVPAPPATVSPVPPSSGGSATTSGGSATTSAAGSQATTAGNSTKSYAAQDPRTLLSETPRQRSVGASLMLVIGAALLLL